MKRNLHGLSILQRTSDGMFNATELMKQWKVATGQEKRIQDFLDNQQTKEFIKVLAEDIEFQQLPKHAKKSDLESVEKESVMNKVIRTTKGRYGATWMHPLLFVKYALWYNPKFELEVMKMVADRLLDLRIDVGDSYQKWCATIASLGAATPEDFSRIQRCMNYAVFNSHQDGIRNEATQQQLEKMRKLEEQIGQMVEFGYLTSLDGVRSFLRKVWEKDFPNPYTESEELPKNNKKD